MNVLLDAAHLFQKGGLVMYPLLACSVIVIAIAVERFRYYRSGSRHTPGFVETLRSALERGDWDETAAVCNQSPGVVAQILAAGLRYRSNVMEMKDTFEGAAALEAANLRKHLGYLETVVTLAPLLGLLGTVIGMIRSFSVLDVKTGNPAAITGGVGEALVATAAGLCVAVLALIIHSYFGHRLDSLMTDIENVCALALEKAKGERG